MLMPDLSAYDNSWYSPGRSKLFRALWLFVGSPLLKCEVLPLSSARRLILRCFGAKIGRGVVLRSGIRIKYPWRLSVGEHTWIGEEAWIDNLEEVRIGANACISQGSYLCTGNHDWCDPRFGLRVQPIVLEDGSWVGTRALVGPGVTVGKCGVITAGSVVTKSIQAFEIHSGNPARFVKRRIIRQKAREGSAPTAQYIPQGREAGMTIARER